MEPPAKRLRILQSVDVDETNHDYVNAKQKQQQKFKGRLESIFAKYESMHESMSDEIDMRENKVVVDRGHLRRLVRQVNRKETVLLDNLGLAAGREPEETPDDGGEEEEEEEEEEESEDELAPTQIPRSSGGRRKEQRHKEEDIHGPRVANSSPSNTKEPETQAMDPPFASLVSPGAQHVPNTPNPAANLLQFVQFPQTPAGQQAQTSFYATLAQTINQAVQQAVAPLFSGMLPRASELQLPRANPFPTSTTPVANSDKIAPATDPKWFFPPLAGESHNPEAVQSSPLPAGTGALSLEDGITQGAEEANKHVEHILEQETEVSHGIDESTFSVTAIMQSEQQACTASGKATRRTSPRVEVQRRRGRPFVKYHFTEEDDIYMSRCKVLEKQTWPQIKGSKEKWRDWPLGTFHQRWHQRLKDKHLHFKNLSSVQASRNHVQISEDEIDALPSHHLPTPSSLRHEETSEQVGGASPVPIEGIMSSSTHFDNDELELLSLAGSDVDVEEEQLAAMHEEEEVYLPETNEIVLPSIEVSDFVDEETLQQGLLEGSPMEEVTNAVGRNTTVEVETKIVTTSPATKRRRQAAPVVHQAIHESEAESDMDLVAASPSPRSNSSLACDICGTSFVNAANLQRHQDNPRSAHDHLRTTSASINLVADDELQAPASATPPVIKRELSTPPPPTSFLFSTPVAQSCSRPGLLSSGVKSASGLDRKTYLKQVKQSWTKKSAPAAKSIHKRRSLQTVPRKRAWSGDSDDELGV